MREPSRTLPLLSAVLLILGGLFLAYAFRRQPDMRLAPPLPQGSREVVYRTGSSFVQEAQHSLDSTSSDEFRMPRTAAEEADLDFKTVLLVTVEAPDGSPVDSGLLTVESSPLAASVVPAWSVITVPISSRITRVELPSSQRKALLTAAVSGYYPASGSFNDLRSPEPVGHPQADMVHKVVLSLSAGPQLPAIGGRVFVDGAPALPAGIEVEISASNTTRKAIIDRHSLSYFAGGIDGDIEGIWATSEETIPTWSRITVRASEYIEQPLHLESGGALTLCMVDQHTSRPLPRYEGLACLNLLTAQQGSTQHFLTDWRRISCDDLGRAVLRGLPAHSTLSFVALSAPREGLTLLEPFYSLDLADLAPASIVEVPVPSEVTGVAILWGHCPQIRQGQEEPEARLYVQQSRPLRSRFVALSEPDWECTVPSDTEQRLWIEQDGVRITESVSLAVKAGRQGPIVLPPASGHLVDFKWSGARPEFRLLVTQYRNGIAEVKVRRDVGTSDGQVSALLTVGNSAEIRISSGKNVIHYSSVMITDALRVVPVSLQSGNNTIIQVHCASETPLAYAMLTLYSMDQADPHKTQALSVQLVDGATPEPVRMLSGLYFYRVDSAEVRDRICGLVDVSLEALESGLIELRWSGIRPVANNKQSTVLIALSGVSLVGKIPDALRTWRVPTDSLGGALIPRGSQWMP